LALAKANELKLHKFPGEPEAYPILAIAQNTLFNRCFAELSYNADRYCVPEEGSHHTKRIFSLLSQLIALKTQTNDLAITPVVRITQ